MNTSTCTDCVITQHNCDDTVTFFTYFCLKQTKEKETKCVVLLSEETVIFVIRRYSPGRSVYMVWQIRECWWR